MEAEWNHIAPNKRHACSHQQLEETNKDPPSLGPLEGAPPFAYLDIRLPASRAVGESISVVLSHQVCGTLSQQPQEMNAHPTA